MVINFDTKIFDTNTNFDVTTHVGRYTAAIAGYYQFNWSVGIITTGSSTNYTMLDKNGAGYKKGNRSAYSGAGEVGSSGSAFVPMAVGDYVEIAAYGSGSGVTVETGSTTSFFDGFLVSAT